MTTIDHLERAELVQTVFTTVGVEMRKPGREH